jgi:hypothetical protein
MEKNVFIILTLGQDPLVKLLCSQDLVNFIGFCGKSECELKQDFNWHIGIEKIYLPLIFKNKAQYGNN